MIFLVDHFFEGKPLVNRVPLRGKDKIVFVDVTFEPKTKQVDALRKRLKRRVWRHQRCNRYWWRLRHGSCQSGFLMMTKSRLIRRLPGMGPCEKPGCL